MIFHGKLLVYKRVCCFCWWKHGVNYGNFEIYEHVLLQKEIWKSLCNATILWVQFFTKQKLANQNLRMRSMTMARWMRMGTGGGDGCFIFELDGDTRPGKHTKNYGTSPFSMGESTISMAIFNSYVTNYQRVHLLTYYRLYVCATFPLSLFIKHHTGRHGKMPSIQSISCVKVLKMGKKSPGEVRRSGAAMIWMRYFSVNPEAFEHFSMTRHLFACGLMA